LPVLFNFYLNKLFEHFLKSHFVGEQQGGGGGGEAAPEEGEEQQPAGMETD